jgi:hypothetical protein
MANNKKCDAFDGILRRHLYQRPAGPPALQDFICLDPRECRIHAALQKITH